MFLMIDNVNEAPVESFTVFGASTSRGESASIGQFGSGAKFGTLVCMRFGLNPIIYSGRDKIEFYSEPMTMKGKNFSRVCYKHKTKTEKTSYTLEFGALDWDNCQMGLREYVSNAIDGAEGDIRNVKVAVVDNPRAKSGHTRVFVPLTPEVQQFYSDLPNRFLHFSDDGDRRGLLQKKEDGKAKVYLKGVFVRESEDKENSLFDYNFGEELDIDESRNLNDWAIRDAATKVISRLNNEQPVRTVLEGIAKQKIWEGKFGGFRLEYNIRRNAELWRNMFHKIYGDDAVLCSPNQVPFLKRVEGKGFNPVIIEYQGWVTALAGCGVKTVVDVLDDVNDDGYVISDASDETVQCAKRVWGWMEAVDMTKGRDLPELKEFVCHMDGGQYVGGFYKDGTVYIEKELVGNTKVMLEELAHYITGSKDNSRDFQDFAFKFGALLGEVLA